MKLLTPRGVLHSKCIDNCQRETHMEKALTTRFGRLLWVGLVVVLASLAAGCDSEPKPPCNRYVLYDDSLTQRIYDDNEISDPIYDPAVVKEIRFYVASLQFNFPCEYDHDEMTLIHVATDKEEIGEYLETIKDNNRTESPKDDTYHMDDFVGMEFVLTDGRMTFFQLWVNETDVSVSPLPEKWLEYNHWGYHNHPLAVLLRRRGILDMVPGYRRFLKEHGRTGLE